MIDESTVVLDASAALAFAFYEEKYHSQAKALVAELQGRGALICAPSMFAYECDSVIRLKVHAGKMTLGEAEEARDLVAALSVSVSYDETILERAWQIANQLGQPRTYDATYAAFAEARGIELWTADKRFYRAAKSTFPWVRSFDA